MLLVNLIAFIVSCFVLAKSGETLVKSLTSISRYLRLSEFSTGFVIISLSTTIPELFVGITSAFAKSTPLALGNVIGSNIADLTLVVGIVVLLGRGIKVKEKFIKKDVWFMVVISMVPLILMVDQRLSRVDGAILLFVFLLYLLKMLSQHRGLGKELADGVTKRELVRDILTFVVCLVLLFASAHFIVKYAGVLSVDLSLPPILIGLFLVAIGTSLPELAFQTHAVLQHHEGLALGNIVGSVVINSTLVLGVTALIYPISNGLFLFFTSAIFMILVAFIFMTFVESGNRLSWREGASLLFLYIFFVIVEFYVKGLG